MSDEKIAKAMGLPTLESYRLKEDVDIEDAEIIEDSVDDEDYSEEATNDEINNEVIVAPEETPYEIVENDAYVESVDKEKLIIDTEYIKDIDKAQHTVSKLVNDSHLAFEQLLLIATQTENPTAFDAASRLLKSIVDANDKMVGLAEKKRDARNFKSQTPNINNNNTTNNTLILTTAEILKALKEQK